MDSSPLSIGSQLEALRERLRAIVENGVVSERRLAQTVGLSQPHIHHVLSGARSLTVEVADRILISLESHQSICLTSDNSNGSVSS